LEQPAPPVVIAHQGLPERMCGIVGILGKDAVADHLVVALRRL
jgi:hypothetical protein